MAAVAGSINRAARNQYGKIPVASDRLFGAMLDDRHRSVDAEGHAECDNA
jgi:hypothetical protein